MFVLDASALLAFLHGERGAEFVRTRLDGSCISAVNYSETVQKLIARDTDVDGMWEELAELGLGLEPFSRWQADLAGRLWLQTRSLGLSLADRACLALALDKSLPIITADRAWGALGLSIDIHLIR